MKCPYCGHENDGQATHCRHCKAELPHGNEKTEQSERVEKKRTVRSD